MSLASHTSAYLRIIGTKQGSVKGSVASKEHAGQIMVIAFDHEIDSPRDAGTGQAIGKRIHKPLMITKPVDASTPVLYEMLVTSEIIKVCDILFWQQKPDGKESLIYTLKLSDVSISEIHSVLRDTQASSATPFFVDNVFFTYRKIEWTWMEGPITASDEFTSGK
ncbi:MAG TPA: type VI secretion system tube protein TssD [Chitinophagales bacterium]|nr:type VI secretion system tube protein TssD [Chitinophagales bacterium]